MLKNRSDISQLIKEFDKLCKNQGIWYSLAQDTMLGAARHGGFVPWVEKFTVMVNVEGFNKLNKTVPNRIAASYKDKAYKDLSISYVADAKKWNEQQAFIEILVVVPSTVEKIQKFNSPFSIVKHIAMWRRMNTKIAINDLIDRTNYNGFYLIKNRRHDINKVWIQVLSPSAETIDMTFMGMQLPVIKEYDKVLKDIYGKDYMTNVVIPNTWKEYPYPCKEIEVS